MEGDSTEPHPPRSQCVDAAAVDLVSKPHSSATGGVWRMAVAQASLAASLGDVRLDLF